MMGIEPTSPGATIRCVNHFATPTIPKKACLEGFEPPTLGLEVRCSIQLSYRHKKAGDGNRTHVAGLEGQNSTIELHPLAKKNYRGGGIRTPDPMVPNHVRYQTALRPDNVDNDSMVFFLCHHFYNNLIEFY